MRNNSDEAEKCDITVAFHVDFTTTQKTARARAPDRIVIPYGTRFRNGFPNFISESSANRRWDKGPIAERVKTIGSAVRVRRGLRRGIFKRDLWAEATTPRGNSPKTFSATALCIFGSVLT
jgi:hypothetical protein